MAYKLDRGGCVENGINPKAIYDFIKNGEKNDIGINSFMLIKNDKIVAEGHYAPYSSTTTHVLYSMSKSITAIALGYAIDEGKLSLNTSISEIFPEYDKLKLNKSITIRHLVTMTAGKMVGMAKNRHDKDWIKIFFDAPFVAPPGKLFLYTNDNFYLLSAIISKVYGETLVDFLYPRLFKPLGIDKPVWETDNKGYAAGGWGLYMNIESFAKIMLCYLHNGELNGEQIIPRQWVEESTKYQVPTVKKGQKEVTVGYGYGFWQSTMPNTYRAYGLYGQSGYVFKDHNTVLIVNSAVSKDELSANEIINMYEHLWDEGNEEYEEKLQNLLSNLGDKDDVPAAPRCTEIEDLINEKTLKTASTSFASVLNATITTVMDKKLGNIDRFIFRKDNDDLYLMWKEQEYINEIKLGMENKYVTTPIKLGDISYTAHTKASWSDNKVLSVYLRIEEACQLRLLQFDFSDINNVKVMNSSIPDLPTLACHYVDFSGFPLPEGFEKVLKKYVAPAVLLIGEPNFRIR